MGDIPSPFVQSSPPPPPPPSPPQPQPKSNLPMLYYGLLVVGTAAIVLAVYNLIIIKWCTNRRGQSGQRVRSGFIEVTRNQNLERQNSNLLSSFKYKKENMGTQDQGGGDHECSVCLSVFQEEEEVRQLPRCKHSFHALCIDMWLSSHSDCPLCRAHVDPPPLCHQLTVVAAAADTPNNSREGLLDSA